MMSFEDFVQEYNLKNKATSEIKKHQVLSSIGLDNVDKYLRDGPISSDVGIAKLHSSTETHWVAYINKTFLIHFVVLFHKNYLNLLQSDVDIVYFLNTKYKV